MERSKYPLIFLIWAVDIVSLFPADSLTTVCYKAYLGNRMDVWKETLTQLDNKPEKTLQDEVSLVDLHYGYIGYALGALKNSQEALFHLRRAQTYLNRLALRGYDAAMISAYRSGLIGLEIGIHPWKAPFIGKKAVTYALEAIKSDSLFPLGYIHYANALYFMPSFVGGSKAQALTYYEKAIALYQSKGDTLDNWHYLHTIALAGRAYLENGNVERAMNLFMRALRVAPDFLWVKDELLPRCLAYLRR